MLKTIQIEFNNLIVSYKLSEIGKEIMKRYNIFIDNLWKKLNLKMFQ